MADQLPPVPGLAERWGKAVFTAPIAGLFTAARSIPSGTVAEAVACAIEETPMGLQVRTDAENKTSIPGVFACGWVAWRP